jgi:hypothetical protein
LRVCSVALVIDPHERVEIIVRVLGKIADMFMVHYSFSLVQVMVRRKTHKLL